MKRIITLIGMAALLFGTLASPPFCLPLRAEEIPDSSSVIEDASAAEGSEEAPPAAPETEGFYAPSFEPAAQGVCMVNEETGLVVYEKNADQPVVAASLVKLMTAMLVVDNVPDLDGTLITSDKSWIYDELYGKNASHADIRLGETLSVRELLYAMLLPSGNEAALLLADHVGGGNRNNFLFMMNSRAETLGCTGTTFVDPNGLSEGNQTTARDICLMMRAFMERPVLAEIAASPLYEMAAHEGHSEPYNILNTNKLITPTSPYYSAYASVKDTVKAGKTGSLGDWQSFASQAEKNGATYTLAVLVSPNEADTFGAGLDTPQERPALLESAALYDWAFNELEVRAALDTTQPVTEVSVRYSTEVDALMLIPDSDLRTILRVEDTDSMIEKQFDLPDFVAAPVEQGDVIGSVTLRVQGREIGSANLIASQSVKRNNTLFAIRKTQEFFTSTYFRVVIILVIAAVCLYIAVSVIYSYLKPNKKDDH